MWRRTRYLLSDTNEHLGWHGNFQRLLLRACALLPRIPGCGELLLGSPRSFTHRREGKAAGVLQGKMGRDGQNPNRKRMLPNHDEIASAGSERRNAAWRGSARRGATRRGAMPRHVGPVVKNLMLYHWNTVLRPFDPSVEKMAGTTQAGTLVATPFALLHVSLRIHIRRIRMRL